MNTTMTRLQAARALRKLGVIRSEHLGVTLVPLNFEPYRHRLSIEVRKQGKTLRAFFLTNGAHNDAGRPLLSAIKITPRQFLTYIRTNFPR